MHVSSHLQIWHLHLYVLKLRQTATAREFITLCRAGKAVETPLWANACPALRWRRLCSGMASTKDWAQLLDLRTHLHLQRCITYLHNDICDPNTVVWNPNSQIARNELQAVEENHPASVPARCRPQKMLISGILQCDGVDGVGADALMRWYLFQRLFSCRSLLLIGTHACF